MIISRASGYVFLIVIIIPMPLDDVISAEKNCGRRYPTGCVTEELEKLEKLILPCCLCVIRLCTFQIFYD